MISFKRFLNESQWMYHGSQVNDLHTKGLRVNRDEYMPDRAIGAHFAADHTVSQHFANGLYAKQKNPDGGSLYRTKAPPRSKLFKIEQRPYPHGGRRSDQYAIADHIAHTVFSHPDNKEMFKSWVKVSRNVNDAEAERLHSHLSQGKSIDHESFGVNRMRGTGFGSFVGNFGGMTHEPYDGFKKELVTKYVDIMRKKGYHGLVYDNTSPMETQHLPKEKTRTPGQRGSTKSYIIFHPEEHKLEKVK